MSIDDLGQLPGWLAERHPDNRALVTATDAMRFSELEQYSRRIARWMSQVLELREGQSILIRLPNDMHLPVVLFGAIRIGVIPVLIPANAGVAEVKRIAQEAKVVATISLVQEPEHLKFLTELDSPPKVIFVGRHDFGNTIERRFERFVRALKTNKTGIPLYWLSEGLAYDSDSLFAWPRLSSDSIAIVQYTAGTTGASKGVQLTHANLIANMQELSACLHAAGSHSNERMLISLPLYFSYPLMLMLTNWLRGGTSAIAYDVRDTGQVAELFDRFKPHVFVGISPVFLSLCQDVLFPQLDFSDLRYTFCGGAVLNETVAKRWKLITGSSIAQGYGLTEASPVVTFDSKLGGRFAHVGQPLKGTQIRIVDEEGDALPFGSNGNIQIKGPQVMKAYLSQTTRGLFPFTPDGWLRTGDIGRYDPSKGLRLIERQHDVIRVPGFRVFPSEIEAIVSQHPSVLDCAIIGLPSEEGCQKIKLFVVTNDRRLTQRQVREYCRQRLTRYKVPDLVEFRASLPHSPSGRVLRQSLLAESLVGEAQSLS